MRSRGPAPLRLLVVAAVLAPLAVPLVSAPAAAAPSAAPPPAAASAAASPTGDAALPDPLARGTYTATTVQETKLGLVSLQEPSSAGAAPDAGTAPAPEQMEIRGALYFPADRAEPSPVVVLVHGNHGSCDSGQSSATLSCAQYKRNEAGYAYLGENLATWGYTVFSVSQDQLMMRQDAPKGKGMHQRRLLIAATLDALSAANAPGGLPVDAHTTIADTLAGRLDMTRIGLMGHSRGGDAVTSFIDYNRTRTDGPRYPLRGVIALAPVDYERKAPYGVPFMAVLPWCDGDVSNLQGARFYERGQYVDGENPFPLIQSSQLGAIHNWYNTVWFADGQDGGTVRDAACGNSLPTSAANVQPNNLRLSGAASYAPSSYVLDNSDTYNPLVNTKISGDPARMGDQEKIGLATMASFLRRYVGGEGAFEPYMTGELSATDSHLQIPASACPTSESGARLPCEERVSTSYFPPSSERVDVVRPEVTAPLTVNALGGALTGTGFSYPYLDNGAVVLPEPTAQGYDWCNPEPDDFAPAQLGKTTLPTAAKPCPLPGKAKLGGQNAMRENSPINHSYGRQLAMAWDAGTPATLTADIPAASRDMSGLKALAMAADVNFFDPRNPGAQRFDESGAPLPVTHAPQSTTQDFVVALIDTAGHEATVHAGDPRWGNALHMSTGTETARTHVVLDQIRVPLSAFATQGVDIASLDRLELRFGVDGAPASGSIELADVRFQERAADAPLILSDGTAPNQGAGYGPPSSGPDPAAFLADVTVAPGEVTLVDTTGTAGANTTWVVDDDRVQCPDASFTSIQTAVDAAAPWDTIAVCAGVYQERSAPVNGPGNPVADGALNGLTITKPLRIKGAGADAVTIMPDQSLATLAGSAPYLRDGGGNVITVSRQSLGSTDTTELFVDISGVTVTSGTVFAEAGIAYFGAAGRVSESIVGPLRTAGSPAELAANPHGWGIVRTGLIQGVGPGTVETELTVANSVVTGYQAGGILFDGGRGTDGAASTTTRSGIRQHGYVVGTVVTGAGAAAAAPQTGVAFTNGFDGFVRDSRVTGNALPSAADRSFGILLSDAGVDTPAGLSVAGSVLTGNGFAVYNGDATGTGVRQGAPVVVEDSYLGSGAPVVGGPADPAAGLEAISAPDDAGDPTVTVLDRAATQPAGVPTGVGAARDTPPTAELVDPLDGQAVAAGSSIEPLVRVRDDHAVRSVSLLADGVPVATAEHAPYRFTWTAGATQKGATVALTAAATDSAGQVTVSAPITVTVPGDPDPTAGFSDVPGSHPFHAEITWLAQRKITTGYADGTFRGMASVNRDAMAAFLYRLQTGQDKAPACTVKPFRDVELSHPFCGEIAWLKAQGIAGGYTDGTYRPATPVARDAMAAFIYRLRNATAEPAPRPAAAPFVDVQANHPFAGEVAWMKDQHLTEGWPDGTFRPGSQIERQAMAAFIYRLMDGAAG